MSLYVQYIIMVLYGIVLGLFSNGMFYSTINHISVRNIKIRYFFSFKQSVIYIIIPIGNAVLAFLCNLKFEFTLSAVIYLIFLSMLFIISLTDIYIMEISDFPIILIGIIGIISYFTIPGLGIIDRLIGLIIASVPLLIIALIVKGGFGGGDIKLMAATGFFLGWKLTLLSLFVGIILGGIYGAILLISKRKNSHDHFAFGPFLCIGMALCVFFGQEMLQMYLKIFDLSSFFM